MRLTSLFRLGASVTFVISAASTALAQSPQPEQQADTREAGIVTAAARRPRTSSRTK